MEMRSKTKPPEDARHRSAEANASRKPPYNVQYSQRSSPMGSNAHGAKAGSNPANAHRARKDPNPQVAGCCHWDETTHGPPGFGSSRSTRKVQANAAKGS